MSEADDVRNLKSSYDSKIVVESYNLDCFAGGQLIKYSDDTACLQIFGSGVPIIREVYGKIIYL